MADNFNINTTQEQAYAASGLNPQNPSMTYVDFARSIVDQAAKQKRDEQLVAEARERIKQAQLASKQKQAASDVGINPELEGYVSVQEAVALLKAANFKDDQIKNFVDAIGDQQYVAKSAVQDVILKRGGATGSLSLIGAKEGQPMQGEDGKWYRTWIKRTPELGIIMTDRVSPTGAAVFQAEDPEGYQAGKTMLSIQDPKLGATVQSARAKATLAGEKVAQNKIKNWADLMNNIDPETKAGANALALAGKANQRADRVFATLSQPGEMTWQRLDAIKTDIAGIFQGGVPPIVSLDEQGVTSWQQKAAKILEFFQGKQAEDLVPMDLMRQMYNLTKEIKAIDNEIINNQVEIANVGFEDVIAKDPARWNRLKSSVLATGHSHSEDSAHDKLFSDEPSAVSAKKSEGGEDREAKKAALRQKLGLTAKGK